MIVESQHESLTACNPRRTTISELPHFAKMPSLAYGTHAQCSQKYALMPALNTTRCAAHHPPESCLVDVVAHGRHPRINTTRVHSLGDVPADGRVIEILPLVVEHIGLHPRGVGAALHTSESRQVSTAQLALPKAHDFGRPTARIPARVAPIQAMNVRVTLSPLHARALPETEPRYGLACSSTFHPAPLHTAAAQPHAGIPRVDRRAWSVSPLHTLLPPPARAPLLRLRACRSSPKRTRTRGAGQRPARDTAPGRSSRRRGSSRTRCPPGCNCSGARAVSAQPTCARSQAVEDRPCRHAHTPGPGARHPERRQTPAPHAAAPQRFRTHPAGVKSPIAP